MPTMKNATKGRKGSKSSTNNGRARVVRSAKAGANGAGAETPGLAVELGLGPADADGLRYAALHDAITESVKIMEEDLDGAAQGGELTDEDFRAAADRFLCCVFNRFENLLKVPTPVYNRYGYLDNVHSIKHKLSRLGSANTVPSSNPRIDSILETLFHEARSLVEAQVAECSHCEHCERKRDHYVVPPDSRVLDDRRLKYAIEGIVEASGGGDRYGSFAFAEHIMGLAHEERYGAINLACKSLIDALAEESLDRKQLLEGFVGQQRENFNRNVAIDLDGASVEIG
jgi:hypothetical protein